MPAKKETLVEVDGQQLALTNLDKLLYPATGTTKRDTIEYLILRTNAGGPVNLTKPRGVVRFGPS